MIAMSGGTISPGWSIPGRLKDGIGKRFVDLLKSSSLSEVLRRRGVVIVLCGEVHDDRPGMHLAPGVVAPRLVAPFRSLQLVLLP